MLHGWEYYCELKVALKVPLEGRQGEEREGTVMLGEEKKERNGKERKRGTRC